MATRRMLAACVILVSCAASGCGTMDNLDQCLHLPRPNSFRIYGGVRNDIEFAAGTLSPFPRSLDSDQAESDQAEGALGGLVLAPLRVALAAIDLPFCLVFDTLTLQEVLSHEDKRGLNYLEKPPQYASDPDRKGLPEGEVRKDLASGSGMVGAAEKR